MDMLKKIFEALGSAIDWDAVHGIFYFFFLAFIVALGMAALIILWRSGSCCTGTRRRAPLSCRNPHQGLGSIHQIQLRQVGALDPWPLVPSPRTPQSWGLPLAGVTFVLLAMAAQANYTRRRVRASPQKNKIKLLINYGVNKIMFQPARTLDLARRRLIICSSEPFLPFVLQK